MTKKKTSKKKVVKKKATKKKAVSKKKQSKKKTKKKQSSKKKGGAPKGNQFWKDAEYPGRKLIFKTPKELWESCIKYFEWVENNPLEEQKIFSYQGKTITGEVSKMRPMTIRGLCLHINIHHSTWIDYRDKKEFSDIVKHIEDIIYDQKFTGAATDLLNSNIIARDLGLKDKKELTGENGRPISVGFYLPANGREQEPEES